jgi:hypothetical protein
MSVVLETTYIFTRTHQNHCTGCGAKKGKRDTYCAVCGFECYDYAATSGVGSQIRGVLGNIIKNENAPSIIGKAGEVINLSPPLAQTNGRPVFAPALIFALVAVGVGLILSFFVDMINDIILRDWLEDIFGRWEVDHILGDSAFKFGAVTVWLLSCLGGLSGSIRVDSTDPWGISSGRINITISEGILLVIIPIVALLIARQARKAYINSKHATNEIHIIDGVMGAGMFAAVNFILSLFPSALSNTISEYFEFLVSAGEIIRLNVNLGPRLVNLLFFSFVIAFLFAMPRYGLMIEIIKRRSRLAGASCAIVVRYIGLTVISGLTAFAVIALYGAIRLYNEGVFDDIETSFLTYVILYLMPNIIVWVMSLFSGGSLGLGVSGDLSYMLGFWLPSSTSVTALGAQIGDGRNAEHFSWFGYLLFIAGLLVAVAALYKVLRNDEKFITSGLIAAVVSAAIMWVISSYATIAISYSVSVNSIHDSFSDSSSAALGSASFANFLFCTVFMAAALGVIYLTRKYPLFNRFIAKATKPGVIYAVVAVATLVACLTAEVV